MPFVDDPDFQLYVGEASEVLRSLPDNSADAVVTSPPYMDARPEYPSPTMHEFEDIFRELARVLSGPALINVGRLWSGGVEHLWWVDLLHAAERAGWSLLDTLVWIKPNANPIHGAVLAASHEYVLILGEPGSALNVDGIRTPYTDEGKARMARTWVNGRGVKGASRGYQTGREINELGARPRSFFTATVGREKGNDHPAPMVLALASHLVKLACRPGETVLDPFAGSGTTNLAARRHGRRSIGIELNEDYARLAARRLQQLSLLAENR